MKYKRKSLIDFHYNRKIKLLEYMRKEQASTDAAVELDIPQQMVWRYLREMQESGHVNKIGESYYAKYKATGKPLYKESLDKRINTGFTVLGVRL